MSYYGYNAIKQDAVKMQVPLKYAVDCRVRFLKGEMKRLSDEVGAYETDEDPVGIEIMLQLFDKNYEQIKKLERERRNLIQAFKSEGKPQSTDEITDDMIQTAREYPIDRLIDFDRQNRAIAFCHPDKTPSLMWWRKGNKSHCFPCGKSFDTISVLMERDGMSFFDAVKRLQ
jgi:hypothetical protein